MKWTVVWQRLSYDAFDDFDSLVREDDFTVEAKNLRDATLKAYEEAQRKVYERYTAAGNQNCHEVHIVGLIDEQGGRHCVEGVSERTDRWEHPGFPDLKRVWEKMEKT